MPLPKGIRAILTDIEGTTTPVAFVYDTLFPFAEVRLEEYCARAAEDSRIAEALETLRHEYGEEVDRGGNLFAFGGGAPYARHLMHQDRKSTGLKALQGIIWEEGYRRDTLKAQVFPDVPRALEAWHREGIRLRVFSSGSVLAQKLLFAHTDHGDLTGYFEKYHDTTTGPKKEVRSYAAIVHDFGLDPDKVLYLSDVVAELDPAREAGLATGLLVRPGNAPTSAGNHPTYPDFLPLIG